MSFLSGLISLVKEFLLFYIPIFFTFKYLMGKDNKKVRSILKFWCILTIYFVFRYLLVNIIVGHLFDIIDICALALLNYNHCIYAQYIYDSFVGPFYSQNKQIIATYSDKIEAIFNKNSMAIKDKVSSSASQKVKKFMGQILVGTINPGKLKRTESSQYSSGSQLREEQEEREKDD